MKITKLNIVLLSIIICFKGYSQIYFNERVEFGYQFTPDAALNVVEVEDGFVLNGRTGDLYDPYWYRLGMIKLDNYGNVIWKKSWGDTISNWYYARRGSLIKSFESYYSIGSKNTWYGTYGHSEMLMIKYNSDFDTVWTKYYGKKEPPYDTSYIPRNFKATQNGFVVVGTGSHVTEGKTFLFLLKTDSLGNVLWERRYGNANLYYEGLSVILTTDYGYAIGGYKFIFGPYGSKIGGPIILKTDSVGNPEWEKEIGGPYEDGRAVLCNSNDSTIIAASKYDTDSIHETLYKSRIQLTKIDNSGNIIWNYLFGDKSYYLKVNNIRPSPNNCFIVTGSLWYSSPNEVGFLLKSDSSGDSLWYRQYSYLNGQDSKNYLYDVINVTDEGFLACGGCYPVFPDEGNQDAWVIKVDSAGCENFYDCWVSEKEDEEIVNNHELLIFPNPAIGKFTVRSRQSSVGDQQIKVYDLFGRKVEEVEIPTSQNKVEILTIGWQKGIYVVKVTNGRGLVGSGKALIR